MRVRKTLSLDDTLPEVTSNHWYKQDIYYSGAYAKAWKMYVSHILGSSFTIPLSFSLKKKSFVVAFEFTELHLATSLGWFRSVLCRQYFEVCEIHG